jgi:phage anti-repressor protein
MEQLIKIQEKDGIEAVSARELYSFLTNDKECRHFKEWSARNVVNNEYATEGSDYQRIPHDGGNNRMMDDYALTVDFSKELCMMSQCAKGKQARQYFIAWEKFGREVQANMVKSATDSAKRRLYINNRIKEIDSNIFHEMKERKNLMKERSRIDANDFQQLSLAIFNVDYDRLPGKFPNKAKMLKFS